MAISDNPKSPPPAEHERDASTDPKHAPTNAPGGERPVVIDDINDPEVLKSEELLPTPEDQIEALGIPNWKELEKKVVKRLDMTLMPCLWVLYLFNYLDRASIA